MSITKSEVIVWTIVAAALAGVVALAMFAGSSSTTAIRSPGAPEQDDESAGSAPEKTSELLPAPAGELGAHAAVERSGREMNTSELRGRFVVADFIFTNCGGTCPMMAVKMSELQSALTTLPDVTLVSFTVDPDRDTPEVLARYAERYDADPARWLFVRCEKPVIAEIACDEVKLWKSRDDVTLHSAQFALIDRDGRVRAYYSPLLDGKWIAKLLGDLTKLRAEPAR